MASPARSLARFLSLAIAAIAFLFFSESTSSSPESENSSSAWPVGRPFSIPVRNGRAAFDIPTPRPGGRTLVIVSALAKSRGPFAIRLAVNPSANPRTIPMGPEPVDGQLSVAETVIPVAPPAATEFPPDRRTFHLIAQGGDVTLATSYLAVEGRLRAVGQRIQVYVDTRDLEAVTESTLRDLVSTFDQQIFPMAARRFGPAIDVDRDGRFTVFFSSWLTRMAGGKVSVDGFVRGADLDLDLSPPFGNRCDMMYLSSSLKAGPHLRTIVAHEYTHAVTFSRKALARGSNGSEEEGWLDEALAHLVEDAHGFSTSNIDYRVSAFLSNPEGYQLVVDDYYTADLFRSHGNRGATYLFLRWCVDRYGPGLIDSLIRSDRRGVANLEAATGISFAELFRNWTVSLYLSGLDPASVPRDAYCSIDPRGDLDEWILAGPRASTVGPSHPEDAWIAQPTSTRYVIVDPFPGSQGVSIQVEAPFETDLQVTTLALPDDLGRPELSIRQLAGSTGPILVEAEVSERDGTAVRLGALSWEPLVPPDDSRKLPHRRGGLDMLGIARTFGTSALPAKGMLRSVPIPLIGFENFRRPMVFKAVGIDARGRRVAAWAIVDFASELEPF